MCLGYLRDVFGTCHSLFENVFRHLLVGLGRSNNWSETYNNHYAKCQNEFCSVGDGCRAVCKPSRWSILICHQVLAKRSSAPHQIGRFPSRASERPRAAATSLLREPEPIIMPCTGLHSYVGFIQVDHTHYILCFDRFVNGLLQVIISVYETCRDAYWLVIHMQMGFISVWYVLLYDL